LIQEIDPRHDGRRKIRSSVFSMWPGGAICFAASRPDQPIGGFSRRTGPESENRNVAGKAALPNHGGPWGPLEKEAIMGIESLIIMLVVGAIAGWLAGVIVKGYGFGLLGNIVVGIVGSFIGGFLLGSMGIFTGGIIGSIIGATIGAVILLLLLRLIRRAA
jgi:uncharacterized membrane protein YeaQ/YmgE (transglycosylase-associated protein family)